VSVTTDKVRGITLYKRSKNERATEEERAREKRREEKPMCKQEKRNRCASKRGYTCAQEQRVHHRLEKTKRGKRQE